MVAHTDIAVAPVNEVVVFGVLLLALAVVAIVEIVHELASMIAFVDHIVGEVVVVVEEEASAAADAVESVIAAVLFVLHQEDQVCQVSAPPLVDSFQHSFVL